MRPLSTHPRKKSTLIHLLRILKSENLERNCFHFNMNKSVESFQKNKILYFELTGGKMARSQEGVT